MSEEEVQPKEDDAIELIYEDQEKKLNKTLLES